MDVLELLNAVNTLRLLLGVDEAAESRLELLTTRAVGHTTQTWAVPVDLSGLRVEGSFLAALGSPLLADLRGDIVQGPGFFGLFIFCQI